jgi:hypothetical protein
MDLKHPEEVDEEVGDMKNSDLNFMLSSSGANVIDFDGETIELAAFDTYRQTACSQMGCAFMKFGGDEMREFQLSGTYNGMWRDCVIFAYLMANDKKVALQAGTLPKTHIEKAHEWAEKMGMGMMSDAASKVADLLGKTIVSLWVSGAEVDQTGSKSGSSLGE